MNANRKPKEAVMANKLAPPGLYPSDMPLPVSYRQHETQTLAERKAKFQAANRSLVKGIWACILGTFALGYLCGLDNRLSWSVALPVGLIAAVVLHAALAVWLPESRLKNLERRKP